MKLRVVRMILLAYKQLLSQGSNGLPDGIPKTSGDFRKIQRDEVVAKLAHKVITRCSPVRNDHEREPVL